MVLNNFLSAFDGFNIASILYKKLIAWEIPGIFYLCSFRETLYQGNTCEKSNNSVRLERRANSRSRKALRPRYATRTYAQVNGS